MRYFSRLIIGFYIKDRSTTFVHSSRGLNRTMNMDLEAKSSRFLVVDHLENEKESRGAKRKDKKARDANTRREKGREMLAKVKRRF